MTAVAGYFAVAVTFALAAAFVPLGYLSLYFVRNERDILRFITGVNIWSDHQADGLSLKFRTLPLVFGVFFFAFCTACELVGVFNAPAPPKFTGIIFAAAFLLRAVLGLMEGFSQYYAPEKLSNVLDRNVMSPIFLLLGICFIIITIGPSS